MSINTTTHGIPPKIEAIVARLADRGIEVRAMPDEHAFLEELFRVLTSPVPGPGRMVPSNANQEASMTSYREATLERPATLAPRPRMRDLG